MSINISPSSITTTAEVGRPFLAVGKLLAIYIDDLDVTEYVKIDSVDITDSLGNIKGMNMTLDEGPTVAISSEIIILDVVNDKRVFGGYVKEITKKLLTPTHLEIDLLVQDFTRDIDYDGGGGIVDFTTDGTESEYDIISFVIPAYATSLFASTYVIVGSTVPYMIWSAADLRTLIDDVAALNGRLWYIDYDRETHYCDIGDEHAPYDLSDSPDYVNTFPYMDLEFTVDLVDSEERGSFKCYRSGLYSGMAIDITNTKLSWVAKEVIIYEVSTKLVAGSAYESPSFVFEVTFGARPKRLTERIGTGSQTGGTEVVNKLEGSTIANWHTDFGSSGVLGPDLVTLATLGLNRKIHTMLFTMRNLTVGASITARIMHTINGHTEIIHEQEFIQGEDTQGLPLISGSLAVSGPSWVEIYSDKSPDDGAEIDWTVLYT